MATRSRMVVVPELERSALERLVGDYLASCRARGLSPRTISAYSFTLESVFLPWASGEGITAVGELDQRALDRYSSSLLDGGGVRKEPLSKDSVHSYTRPVRQLLAWAQREGEAVKGTPQLPKLPRRMLTVLTREQMQRLEDHATAERDKLIIRALADTGLRVGELVGLRPDDIVATGRAYSLRVRGKGGRERMVPAAPSLIRRLERYLRARPADTYSDHLFLALRRNRDGHYGPLTVSGVEQVVGVTAERAGLDRSLVHPHALRHAFVTNALRGGMNPMIVAQIVGHESLRMIERVYSHLTVTDAHDAMMRLLATTG